MTMSHAVYIMDTRILGEPATSDAISDIFSCESAR